MTHPWRTWCWFAVCALVALAALGWVTTTTLSLERDQFQAARQAELEERVRLALWRMDSALAPLLIEESARPWTAYDAAPRAESAHGGGLADLGQRGSAPQQTALPAPPVTIPGSSNILLHFQLGPGRGLTSPEVPASRRAGMGQRPEVAPAQTRLASNSLAQLARLLSLPVAAGSELVHLSPTPGGKKAAARPTLSNRDWVVQETAMEPEEGTASRGVDQTQPSLASQGGPQQPGQIQQLRNSAEFAQRANAAQQVKQTAFANNLAQQAANGAFPAASVPRVGLFKPLWLGDEIMLVRRVEHDGDSAVQGVWLNWTNLSAALLTSARDLFPAARLIPAPERMPTGESRLLASLPAKLDPGMIPSAALPWRTPTRLTLALAWAGLVVAAVAVALLLYGAVSLSERRAAFVSAVTHELRTPLTTFRMYSEMLAEDMVPDPAKRRQYLDTLSVEASRLSHLVENVLAYARLERGSARRREESLSVGQMIERVKPRLTQRAEQAGMSLIENEDPAWRQTAVRVDVSAVEQILFNLVDNACKYAAPTASEKVIRFELLSEHRFAVLRVRDHGPGLTREGVRRLFQPFSKSAHEAAQTAPGVGLGLALCRRLSRGMGGDLRLGRAQGQGACFELLLPLAHASG